jgi:hypothetical protein
MFPPFPPRAPRGSRVLRVTSAPRTPRLCLPLGPPDALAPRLPIALRHHAAPQHGRLGSPKSRSGRRQRKSSVLRQQRPWCATRCLVAKRRRRWAAVARRQLSKDRERAWALQPGAHSCDTVDAAGACQGAGGWSTPPPGRRLRFAAARVREDRVRMRAGAGKRPRLCRTLVPPLSPMIRLPTALCRSEGEG